VTLWSRQRLPRHQLLPILSRSIVGTAPVSARRPDRTPSLQSAINDTSLKPAMQNKLIQSIKERIEQFEFRSYGHPQEVRGISAEDLSKKTDCGILTARIITEAFPGESGQLETGDFWHFNNYGIDGFIQMILDRCPEFPAQGYFPILEDTCGNMVVLPRNASNVDRVVLVGMDTIDPDTMNLKEHAVLYNGTLLDLFDQMLTNPSSDMFDKAIDFTDG
jgi:hypothetical protein